MTPKLFIFDIDGTVLRGRNPVPYAAQVVSELRSRGAQIRFLTNNSGSTQEQLRDRLYTGGIQCEESEIVTSATGAARWLGQHRMKTAFLVGEYGLDQAVQQAGISISDHNPDAIVVGICRTITYGLIDKALHLVANGAQFIATNTDATFPIEHDDYQPGAGAIVGAIRGCTNSEPIVIGKPNPYLINWILEESGTNPEDALVIGDRYETDIQAGIAAGCGTMLVKTGAPIPQEWSHLAFDNLMSLLD